MIKRAFVKEGEAEKLLIDSNRQISDKMAEIISAAAAMQQQSFAETEGSDEFTEGLVADKVEMLLGDQDGEGEEAEALAPSNVIKNKEEAVAEAQAAAEEVLAGARAEADGIVAEANSQAEALMAEANEQVESIKQEARNEGFSAGHDEGYQAGMQEVDAMKAEYESMIGALQDEYQKKMAELEPMFVDLITDIYEHVFHVKLSDEKDIIFYLIQGALRNAEGGDDLVIHVSKDDYTDVTGRREELLQGIAHGDNAEIVEDVTLKKNECFIETGGGIFDCSLETELMGLKKELKLLSYDRPAETGD